MPLADKITDLRKKQGWSQIDLADRLDVSRQSVSKWEMAQAVPELDKIIKMSELFSVTTDYLLKDDAPAQTEAPPPPPPEEPPQAAPAPETGPAPVPEAPKKHRRLVLAACLVLPVLIVLIGVISRTAGTHRAVNVGGAAAEQAPGLAVEEAVMEQPAGPALEETAVSDPDAAESPATEYVYEGTAVTSGDIDPEALAAMAAEYAPYGLTCDLDGARCQWYLDGQPVRVFTDILTSNGESLTGGDFQGVIRNFAGEGSIDVRTVRDYDHCDEDGCGTLLRVESCDVRLDSAQWVEHHAEDHHGEDHHE